MRPYESARLTAQAHSPANRVLLQNRASQVFQLRSLSSSRQAKHSFSVQAHSLLRVMATSAGTDSTPFTIVGKGRVGKAIQDMGAGGDVLLGRGEAIDGLDGPIIVCTRNNDLQGTPSRALLCLL